MEKEDGCYFYLGNFAELGTFSNFVPQTISSNIVFSGTDGTVVAVHLTIYLLTEKDLIGGGFCRRPAVNPNGITEVELDSSFTERVRYPHFFIVC